MKKVIYYGCALSRLRFALLFLVTSTAFGQVNKAALSKPSSLNERAPNVFKAKFDTTAGVFIIEVHTDWAPIGAGRFYNLVKNGFYDECRFFRVVRGFVVQFGINGDPSVQKYWEDANIPDEKVKQSNFRGYVTFAKSSSPNSRTTQLFINFADNSRLDSIGFAPFGKVISGMEAVEKINATYGQMPDQDLISNQGNAYLTKNFPRLDYIKKATIEK
jgi:peptidyl-prolyl cis-trans isomerase A (cyclophilin A)